MRAALARPDMCHREPEFAALTVDVLARLGRVYGASSAGWLPVLLSGSGTLAVEAMLATFVPRAGKALVVQNGVYGERMASMLEAQGKPFAVVRAEWSQPMDLARVTATLAADDAITHVLAVHNETTTGRLNDVAALGRICTSRCVPLLLDAVSSFGAEEIGFGDWGTAAIASTANKCVHGVPGAAFVLAHADLLTAPSHASSLYLDLRRYREQATGSSPFTPAVHSIFALQEALAELEDEGGWRARNARYAGVAKRIRAGLADVGLELLLPAAELSSMISSFRLPAGFTYQRLHDELKAVGFVIYAGQGAFAQSMFRIANMGRIDDDDVDRLLREVRRIVGRA